MRSVLDKIADSLEGHISVAWEGLTDRFSVLANHQARVNPAVWQAVAQHLEEARVIEMDYEKFNGDRGTYCLEPYPLLAYHGNWYLLARNIRNDRVVTFALSRVKGIHASQRVFERPARFDARAWFQDAFGITRGDNSCGRMTAVWRCGSRLPTWCSAGNVPA